MASINLQSKDGGADDGSRSPARSRVVSAPWSKIVRGGSDEFSPPVVFVTAPAASPSSSSVQEQIINASSDWYPSKAVPETTSSPDDSGTECQPEVSDNVGGCSNAIKKPVWSKPSNGIVEAVSPVMGAVSWPALGESTKASPKSSSSESLQALSDGSLLPTLQAIGNSSPSSHKLASNNVNPTSTPNHIAPSGQRSIKRGGGSSGVYLSSNGGVSQRSPASQDTKVEAHNASGKPGTVATDSYPKDQTYKDPQKGGFGSQSNSGNDYHHQRNSYRRGNGGGQHPRGDGSYHHYGGKLEQGRGNQEWNQQRSFNNRDPNMQPQRGFRRGYMRPSVHNSTPFIPPSMPVPVRPFGNNVMYPDMASAMIYVQGPPPPESLRSMSLVAPIPAPMYFPVPDPLLHSKIVNQIDYYFSNENLVKDTYLRRNMDEQGWVPVNLIAGFKKVSCLTDNVQLILDTMRTSSIVEVQGEKIRRRNDWMRWLMPPPAHYSSGSHNQDVLVSQFERIGLEESTSKNQVHVEPFSSSRSSSSSGSGEFGSQLQQGGGEGSVVHISSGFERATVA
ncbi:la-related protein 1C-like [Cynara cardunculus var. scolymus]|uniref:RNA-binding protein Lupus La n=1 Tax=Cynara cardunculus var. scolymus TaxID=59895 RepID=A0A103Y5K4_CYNCS|nr:la-related protein 1C-like [Cynara cardunculus var. scolymus]KVI02922.1 RNA-binding protein Lupus La [Cynara cardunculus var. scolymus]